MNRLTNKLAIGTAQFGLDYGVANQKGQLNKNEIQAILDFASKNGINTLDTAKAYGASEVSIGEYLKLSDSSWNIITKIGSVNNIIGQIKDSIKKLNIKPNIVLAHSADLFLNPSFQTELQKAKDQELIKYYGVSLYNDREIYQVLKSELKPTVVQLPMNILDTRLYKNGLLNQLFENGIEIHIRSVFLQGLFYLSKDDLNERFKDVNPGLDALKSIAKKAELTLAELSLLWVASIKEVDKVIIGVDNVDHLKAHFKTLEKNVDPSVFIEVLSIKYENENILNPSLWPIKS